MPVTQPFRAYSLILTACLALAILPLAATRAAAVNGKGPLAAPFDVAGQRAMWGRDVAPLGACPAAPEPVRDVIRGVYYKDGANSVRDPVEYRRTINAVEPLWAYSGALSRMANDHVASIRPDPARAVCVLAWLDRWAAGGALQGEISTWAHYDLLWGTGISAAMAYLKVRDTPGLDPGQRRRVEKWLAALARTAIKENERYNAWRDVWKPGRSSLSFWTAAYSAVAGIAADDRALFDWGVAIVRLGLAGSITAEGALSSELDRAGRSFAYHVWSLEPMMIVAVAAHANGIDLTAEHDGALVRMVRFMLRMRAEPERIAILAGSPQQNDSDPRRWPSKDSAAALEMFQRLRPSAEVDRLITPMRPISSKFSGGDFTLLFARK